jgi:enamine deaminase RidA (YjgF/YER057c/UK114 family)
MAQREAVFPADRHALYEQHGYSAAVRSDDLLFVSGQVGSRPDGSAEPDFEAQVRLAFANLEATLFAAGCGFDDVIDVTSFHTDPEKQFETIMAVKGEIFKSAPYPNWTALGVNWLAGFDFEIKVVARIPAQAPATVRRHNPPTIWDMASGGYSQISVAEPGRLAFLSGQVGWLPSGGDAPNDVAGQARIATANLAAALTELGASGEDIVILRVYVVNATTEKFQQVQTLLDELKGDGMPSITTIGVQALYSPDILVEIEMVVRVP